MSLSKLQKISKQPETTWTDLHQRLLSMPFDYSELLSSDVYQFVRNIATSVSSCEGYFLPCLITTTAFVIGNSSLIRNAEQTMPINLFSVVIGPPTTGKSVALNKCCMEPLITLRDNNDMGNFMLERCTSSGMVKCLSEQKKAFVASPEVYDFLHKLLKNDEEKASGEVQLLCELFSGERSSYRYATENKREIGANIPMCILGLTQVPFGVRLLCHLDQGHGLLDRFLFYFPYCLRPSPKEADEARVKVQQAPLKSFTDVFLEIFELHLAKRVYSFTEAATGYLNSIQEDFITELNECLLKGEITPKCKRFDLIQRVAVSLHVFNHVTGSLLKGRKPRESSQNVGVEMVKKAQLLVSFSESQKQVVLDVSIFWLPKH